MAFKTFDRRIEAKDFETEHTLGAREIERLSGVAKGDMIICTRGILWVTQEGDLDDHLLRSGDQFIANRHGVVLVEAMTPGACRFSRN